jgi:hypothetical protein
MARRWEVGCFAICVIPNTVNQGSRRPLNRQEAVSHRHFTVGTVLPMGLPAEVVWKWVAIQDFLYSIVSLAVNTLKRVRTLSPSRSVSSPQIARCDQRTHLGDERNG